MSINQKPRLIPCEVVKKNQSYTTNGYQITTLLRQLGLKINKGKYCNNFWNKEKKELEWVLYDATELYKQKRIKIHPDRHPENEKLAADLGELFQTIKKRIESHINPVIIPQYSKELISRKNSDYRQRNWEKLKEKDRWRKKKLDKGIILG